MINFSYSCISFGLILFFPSLILQMNLFAVDF
jgi:hypothetical protein